MEILLQIVGFSTIPLFAILIAGGVVDVYQGLKEHYKFRDFKVSEIAFSQNSNDVAVNFGFAKLNTDFCKS